MRLFIGIDLPDYLKLKIECYLQPLKQSEKGWEKAHDYHQTLLFIGECGDSELSTIKSRLSNFHFDSMMLYPTTFQFFNRRVMYLGLEKTPELLLLKQKIDEAFPEWAARETKSFHPHITVKRWQRYEHAHLSTGLLETPWKPEAFKVQAISLFKSEKNIQGEKYHVLMNVPLAAPKSNLSKST